MGKSKYETTLETKTAPELIKARQKLQNVKDSRPIGYYTATISAKLSVIKVNLFFYILSYVKRNESYETIEGLFTKITKNFVELSVAVRIWLQTIEVISVIVTALNCDVVALTE